MAKKRRRKQGRKKVPEKDFHKWYKKKGWSYGNRFNDGYNTFRYFYKKTRR